LIFRYTGRENDGTGLYYYRARYYHPGAKRFIAEDPIGQVKRIRLITHEIMCRPLVTSIRGNKALRRQIERERPRVYLTSARRCSYNSATSLWP